MEISGQRDLLLYIVDRLNQNRIPYILTGSLVVSSYGYPRTTHDIDFIIEITSHNRDRILNFFKNLDETFVSESPHNLPTPLPSIFTLFHIPTALKIDLWILSNDSFERSKFKRRKKIIINGQEVYAASPEDIILTKLRWCKDVFSEKHLRDCAGIWKTTKNLDKSYLNQWAKKIEIENLLAKIKKMEY